MPTPKTTLLVQEVVTWLMVQEVTLVEALFGNAEVIGEVMKRDGGLVEAMGGCRPPTPAPAGWVRLSEALSQTARTASGTSLIRKCPPP